MTISTYQIDNVLKAYSRQSKVSSRPVAQDVATASRGTPTCFAVR